MIRKIGVPNQCTDLNALILFLAHLREIKAVDVYERSRRLHSVLHQVDKIRAACKEFRATHCPEVKRFRRSDCPLVLKRSHADTPLATARTAATMFGYAPHRQMLPLMRSQISSSDISGCSVLPL
jgi:hypothetical protein